MRSKVESVSPIVFGYGLLGLLPFLAPPLLSLLVPEIGENLAMVQAAYAALILSFLGGARWAFEVARPQPRFAVVTLAMLPSIAGLALLMLPDGLRTQQLAALAGLLLLHGAWDARSTDLPGWYPRLRTTLTVGAAVALIAEAVISAG